MGSLEKSSHLSPCDIIHFLNIIRYGRWQRDIDFHIEHLEDLNELRILYNLVRMMAPCTPFRQLEPKVSCTVEMSASEGCDGVLTSRCLGIADFDVIIQVPSRVFKMFVTTGDARVSIPHIHQTIEESLLLQHVPFTHKLVQSLAIFNNDDRWLKMVVCLGSPGLHLLSLKSNQLCS